MPRSRRPAGRSRHSWSERSRLYERPERVFPFHYLAKLTPGKIALWCFLIWYLATVLHHFDPTPSIWLNALGISAIIGVALYLSVRQPGKPPPDRCTALRLFLMPFC